MSRKIPLFVHQDINEVREALGEHLFEVCLNCYAGRVGMPDNTVDYFQKGAEDLFSIGQPVFDDTEEGRLMGYLGVDLWEHLNYSTDGRYNKIEIPAERWRIFCPTKYCEPGKKIILYWQKFRDSNVKKEEE